METRKTGTADKGGARYLVFWCQKGYPFWAVNEYLLETNCGFCRFWHNHGDISTQPKNERYLSLHKLNWLGHREPIPLCQSKQIAKQRKPIAIRIVQKNRNTTCPSPPPRSSRGANAPIPSTSKGGQGDPQPPTSSSSSKKNGKPKINRPSPHTNDPIAMYSRFGVLDVVGGATRTPSSPLFLFLSSLLSNGTCVVCRPTERSSVYCYLSMTPQPSAYKKLYSIVIKLPSKTIHTMAYLLWKITAHFMVV